MYYYYGQLVRIGEVERISRGRIGRHDPQGLREHARGRLTREEAAGKWGAATYSWSAPDRGNEGRGAERHPDALFIPCPSLRPARTLDMPRGSRRLTRRQRPRGFDACPTGG
jgi:hypothetical protein